MIPYVLVTEKIRISIVSGKYVSHSKLPTLEQLAKEHEVAVNTVKKAIAVLEDEGLVVSFHGKGVYVK